MKLYTVTLTALYLCMIFSLINSSVFYARKLEQKKQEVFLCCTAKQFISQSFKKTCSGKGFKNLEEWKNVCNALFELEAITFQTDGGTQNLFYAEWKGSDTFTRCSGQVYFLNQTQKGESLQ